MNASGGYAVRLVDLLPDADMLCALEPEELGLRMLPALASWREHYHGGFLSLAAALNHWISDGRYPGEYFGRHQGFVEEALCEAWAWLEGQGLLVPAPHGHTRDDRLLSRRARLLAKEGDALRVFTARRIPKETLHPSIREDVWSLFHRGKLDTAVFEAMKAVEVAVRDVANLMPADIGTALMRKAFEVHSGPLTDKSAEPAERQARSDLTTLMGGPADVRPAVTSTHHRLGNRRDRRP